MADMKGETCDQGDPAYCPYFHRTIELIGRRWTGATLLAMSSGCTNYSEIRDAIPGISDRLLSERLKELETEGIVSRTVVGRSTNYELTDRGTALGPILDAVANFAEQWMAPA